MPSVRDDNAAAERDQLATLAADAERCLDQLGAECTAEDEAAVGEQRRSFLHTRQMLSHRTHLLLSEYSAIVETDDQGRDDHVHKVRQQRVRLESHLADVRACLAAQRRRHSETVDSAGTGGSPVVDPTTEQEAAAIQAEMVKQMERRRMERPERRQRPSAGPLARERRRLCLFCYQPGDHRTAAECLGALER
jgi:hypothetical protein